MNTQQAQGYAIRLRTLEPRLKVEALRRIADSLVPAPTADAEVLLSVTEKWGFDWRRFERTADYIAHPWPIQIEDFTPAQIIELLYRCAEVHEDGGFKPLDLCLRRPGSRRLQCASGSQFSVQEVSPAE